MNNLNRRATGVTVIDNLGKKEETKKKGFIVELNETTHSDFKSFASENRMTMSKIARNLIKSFLEQNRKQ